MSVMTRTLASWMKQLAILTSLAVLVTFSNNLALQALAATNDEPCDPAMSVQDCQALYGWPNWIPEEAGINVCGSGSVTLTGSDNQEKTWNFFKGKGLANVTVAAIFGNLMHESTLSPTIIQNGGTSQDPADAGGGGWGIAQWTPGVKAEQEAAKYKITSPIYELGTQLQIVWEELNKTAPTGQTNVLGGLKKLTDLTAAVSYFELHFEAPADPAGSLASRVNFAKEGLRLYGGGDTVISAADTSPCGSTGSVNCSDTAGVTGVARILCEAKKYDPVSYVWGAGHGGGAAWHSSCPTIDASCGLDCSGLVNLAVYDAFGVDLRQNTYAEVSDKQHWKEISVDALQPGDIIQPNPDHVEIVDHISGDLVYTFGAHSNSPPQSTQVGPASAPYSKNGILHALHYVGST